MSETVHTERRGPVLVVTIDRPEARNAVDRPTAEALAGAFTAFDADDELAVAVLTGASGTFCAGADLKAVATNRGNRVDADVSLDGPMGPTRMLLDKPVIAAVEGFAVAGGLELAVWCDLRVAADDAVFGVYCRRWGVPLVDGGTIRLPRLIGHSHALDLILTGRGVSGDEAVRMGLVNRLGAAGHRPRRRGGAGRAARGPAPGLPAQRPPVELRAVVARPARARSAEETRLGIETIASAETLEGASALRLGRGPPRRPGLTQPAQPAQPARPNPTGPTGPTVLAPRTARNQHRSRGQNGQSSGGAWRGDDSR